MAQYTSTPSGHGLWEHQPTVAEPPVRRRLHASPPARVQPEQPFTLVDQLTFWPAWALMRFVQIFPLVWVAQFGRGMGAAFYYLDGKHRRIVLDNLTKVFGREKSAAEIRAIAHENFKRIGENYVSAIKTAGMTFEQLQGHVEFTGLGHFPQSQPRGKMKNLVVAIGHFGNFEMYARIVQALPHNRVATTYRGLKPRALNRLIQSLRAKSGCYYFERRTDGAAMRAMLNRGGLVLGLLSDQNSKGLRAPFLGVECNTGLAPAILALRYHAALVPSICYRVGLAKWRVETGKPVPTHIDGRHRTPEEIMLDVNRELEAAVRRDPANWFWVHRRWKK